MISHVQDEIIDALGHGWPEYYPEGTFQGILLPIENSGGFWWALHGQPLVALGNLHELG